MKESIAATLAVALLLAGSVTRAESNRMQDGSQAYIDNCAQCHESGLLGAPQTLVRSDWADRSHLWEAVLVEHAGKGYLGMPKPASDAYAIGVAAEYMLSITHPHLPRD